MAFIQYANRDGNSSTNEITPMTFDDLFPNLAAWAELGYELHINHPQSKALIQGVVDGSPVYQSPPDTRDLQQALTLADAALGEWLDENEDD